MLQIILDKIWRFFASLKTGLALLGLLALVNLVGSFILQHDQVAPGQIERTYSPTTLKILDALGLFDLYHSWWFILLLTLTGISLIIASIDIWPRFWSRVVAWQPELSPGEYQQKDLNNSFKVQSYSFDILQKKIELFLKKHFAAPWVHVSREKLAFFAQRGRWSHLGVFVIHTGLLLILIGGFIGMRYGFEGQIKLRKGTASDLFFDERGRGKAQPLGFTIRCNDVWMERYPDGSPKAYYSDLDVIENGQVVKSKTIRVNDPLGYKGIHFYQATYGTEPVPKQAIVTLAVTERSSGEQFAMKVPFQHRTPLPSGGGHFTIIDYRPNFQVPVAEEMHELGQAVHVSVESDEEEKNFWIFERLPGFDGDVRKGTFAFVLQAFDVDYDAVPFTGLAVASNPGIPIIWTGSAILLLGLAWVIMGSHRKIWIQVRGQDVMVAAQAHRNEEHFAKKYQQWLRELEAELQNENEAKPAALREQEV